MASPENESPDDPLRAHGITIRDSAEPVNPNQDKERTQRQTLKQDKERTQQQNRNQDEEWIGPDADEEMIGVADDDDGVDELNEEEEIDEDEDEGTRSRQWGKIARFYSAGPAEATGAQPKNFLTLYQSLVPYGFPDWLLPIAVVDDALDQGMLCIAVKGEKQGRIYYWPEQEIGEDTFHWVADSFNSFLALLG